MMHRFVDQLARFFAVMGGTVLTVLIVQTCLSILGRSISAALHSDLLQSNVPDLAALLLATGVGSVSGAFELVEAGMAFVIFAFLPLCQLHGAHASVDIFTARLPDRANRFLRMLVELVFAAVMVVIAWQLFLGLVSKYNSGQTTFLVQYPVWWAYGFSLTGAGAAAIVAVYVAAMRVIEVATGRDALPATPEAGH